MSYTSTPHCFVDICLLSVNGNIVFQGLKLLQTKYISQLRGCYNGIQCRQSSVS